MRKEVHIMELQDVLNERRSIRNYDADKKVTKEQLEIIINAAILAPSWKIYRRQDITAFYRMK